MKYVSRILTIVFSIFLTTSVSADEVSPTDVSGATTVNTAEAKALFDEGVYFVDVRKDSDWEAGRVPDAIHIELKKVFSDETLTAEVEKDAKVVIYCNGEKCLRSSQAAAKAVEWGFSNVYYYRDGFPAWKAAGNPVE
ncbi:rhodanese-like domain-containing protein [Kiloniella litopenaei]|uniref:rhodanese-like domain-containing protein n=1 Tax=Kiloniella litopenaei TaxID=1549748 RepID=UPI000697BAB4|nr:rhodanese-like domain-containing protein [Kiloniella litopenaei]